MPRVPFTRRLRDQAHFLARFLRHPRTIGAVAPSSAALARAMVAPLDPARPMHVVELGAGFGAFTGAITERLNDRARFLAIDIEPTFVAALHERWPALDCVCAPAEALESLAAARGLLPIDAIVSGLPFASLPGRVTREILDAVERTLRPGGTFTTFQYVHAFGLPPAVRFRRDVDRRMGAGPERQLVTRNVPPAWALTWRRVTAARDRA